MSDANGETSARFMVNLSPETCVVAVEQTTREEPGGRLGVFDLVEYACDGPQCREVRRRRIPAGSDVDLDQMVHGANLVLRRRHPDCPCR